MYRWLNSEGQTVVTRTVNEFAERFNFPPSMARSLAAGVRSRLRGWCSTSRKPKVKKHRERFMTKLVHLPSSTTRILGSSLTQFARENGLCENEVWKLVNGRKIIYRGWILQKTIDAANFGLAENFW